MDLSDPITVIIACPLLEAVTNRVVRPSDPLVSVPVVGVDGGFAGRVAVNVGHYGAEKRRFVKNPIGCLMWWFSINFSARG